MITSTKFSPNLGERSKEPVSKLELQAAAQEIGYKQRIEVILKLVTRYVIESIEKEAEKNGKHRLDSPYYEQIQSTWIGMPKNAEMLATYNALTTPGNGCLPYNNKGKKTLRVIERYLERISEASIDFCI
jgi:hypothetical protein